MSSIRRILRANAVPMAILWSVAVIICVAYYQVPSVTAALDVFGRAQVAYGKVASFVNRIVTGGLIPGFFVCLIPALRPKRLAPTILLQIAWSGLMGLPQDCWFACEEAVFGPSTSAGIVIAKTLADQFLWAAFVMTPLNALFYTWLGNDFSCRFGGRRALLARLWGFYRVNLTMNWLVWIPAVAVVYIFPLPLQMTVSGLVGALWSLLCLKTGDVSAQDSRK